MAVFQPAVEQTLQNEGGFFHNQKTGEVVNYGVTLKFASGCGLCGSTDQAYIQGLTQQQAIDIYNKYFWDAYHIGSINDQTLANKTFDLTVNMGPGGKEKDGGLTLLQRAVCDCGGTCIVDGILGPQSLSAINALDPGQLLTAYRGRAKARYEEIAQDPVQAGNLSTWLARLAT
ncbi:MAG TPA: glycosyl hydrolase 108 family protein [Bryobacteraceae bacterium]|nr:glycosyl hydrolase 108 family protein [Bryobacteraceae bacterium]